MGIDNTLAAYSAARRGIHWYSLPLMGIDNMGIGRHDLHIVQADSLPLMGIDNLSLATWGSLAVRILSLPLMGIDNWSTTRTGTSSLPGAHYPSWGSITFSSPPFNPVLAQPSGSLPLMGIDNG